MQERYVNISRSTVNTIAFSSIFNIGDTVFCNPKFKAIAVQRETNSWNENYDLQFTEYPIFQKEANWIDVDLPIHLNTVHHTNIHVDNVMITSISQSSSIQFGGIKKIHAESRLKHIRILENS